MSVCTSTTNSCLWPTTGSAPQIFASALQYFAAAQCIISEDWPPDADCANGEFFDFIIVGGGTAGCILASRLSEVEHWRILLIHEGGDPPIESIIPQLETRPIGTNFTWNYKTAYDGKIGLAHTNGTIDLTVTKMLGGGSSVNGMVYVRGDDHTFEEWFRQGNPDWNLESVKQSFKKAERLEDPKLLRDPHIKNYYGVNGRIGINVFNSTDIAINEILSSMNVMGFRNKADINSADTLGSTLFVGTISKGRRESTAKAYLAGKAGRRSNLKVMKFTTATKILISRSRKAYGVEVKRGGKTMQFYAHREVILSAGAICTPKLLMLSGIGPKKHLSTVGIPTIIDLPVGENYHDHCPVPVTIYGNIEANPIDINFEAMKYIYNNSGFYADNYSPDIGAFYSVSKFTKYPDIQVTVKVFAKNSSVTRTEFSGRNYEPEIMSKVLKENANNALIRMQVIQLHPLSRGRVFLRSNNPDDSPVIDSKYFHDERDLEQTVDGIIRMTRIVNTPYFKSIGAYLSKMGWTPCDQFKLESRDYWRCMTLHTFTSMRHYVGTARMGESPIDSVVDNRLRVHGIDNLRVIDASIMPNITGGNTNAPVIMIAEKGADFIKSSYRYELHNF